MDHQKKKKKKGITRPRPDGGVKKKKTGITRPRPDGGVKHRPAMRAEPTKCWFVSKRKQARRA